MTAFNAPPALLFLDSTVNSGKKETLVCCESDSPLFSVKLVHDWCFSVHWASKQAETGHKSSHPGPLTQTEDPVLVGVFLHPGVSVGASLLEPPQQPVVCFDELI